MLQPWGFLGWDTLSSLSLGVIGCLNLSEHYLTLVGGIYQGYYCPFPFIFQFGGVEVLESCHYEFLEFLGVHCAILTISNFVNWNILSLLFS